MYDAVCEYVERLFALTRPRRLVYMAIDGVGELRRGGSASRPP